MVQQPNRLISIWLLLATSATALAATDGRLEEIVVTAEFSPADPREVPSSVVVLDDALIQQAATQHFEELSLLVPNLTYSGEGNRAQYFQIRGIGELAQYEGAPNPSVGFIVDDVDFSGLGGIATLFDVHQIEVLRGPQGTRYGANALAGLVYVTTTPAPERFDLSGEVTFAQDGAKGLGVSVGGPLAGQVAGRLSWHHYQSDGFRSNPFLGRNDTHRRDETALRGKLSWQPNDTFDAQLTAFYVDLDDGYDAFAIDNGLTVYSDNPGRDAQRSLAAALRLTRRWERIQLLSISSMAQSNIAVSFDADWGNDDFWAPFQYDFISATRRSRDTLSQELRIASLPAGGLLGGRLDWVVGLYGLELTEVNDKQDAGIYVDPAFAQFPFVLDSRTERAYEATNLAAFVDVQYSLPEPWTLAAGLRVENRSADYRDNEGNLFSPDETMLGGQLTLTRELTAAANLYARLARGYKAGGFNLGVPADDPRALFDREYLVNYEVGLKISNARWSGDLVLFLAEREEQQVETTTQLDPNNPASFVFFTSNAGRGFNRGLEASARWRVAERWLLSGGLGLLKTKVEQFGNNGAIEGREQPHAPAYSYHLGISYEHPRGWFGRLDMIGRAAAFIDYFEPGFTPNDPLFCINQRLPGYRLVNARVGYGRPRWSAAVWVRNLFDEEFATRGFCFGNEPPAFPEALYLKQGDPRQVGITFKARF